jgi:ankyrin repeat protein
MATEPTIECFDLWSAALHESIVDVERLVVEAPDTIEQKKGNRNITPLGVAVNRGNIRIATLLLEAGANPNSVDVEGLNPIAIAARENELQMIRLLLHHGGEVLAATITMVVDRNHSGVMCIFIENGLVGVERKNRRGRTPMHVAALYDNQHLFHVLVELNGNVRATADNGATPLHYAAQEGHNRLVEELIRLGASVSAKTDSLGASLQPISVGVTPLHSAALGGAEYALVYMLDNGGDIDATDDDGQTLMHYAAERGHAGIIRILIARGVDMEPTSANGGAHDLTTPERLATHYMRLESAELIRAEIERRKQLITAFAMGDHKRLGEGSRLRLVDEPVLRMIMKRVCK